MGDFREQLLKAGLVTAEQAKQAAEPPRPPPRPARPDRPERQAPRDRHDRSDRPRQDRGPGSTDTPPSGVAPVGIDARAVAGAGKLDGRFRGGRRWYYVSRRGHVPYLELNDDASARLESGAAAIVESPGGETWLVDGDSAKLLVSDPSGGRDWVRVFNRGRAQP